MKTEALTFRRPARRARGALRRVALATAVVGGTLVATTAIEAPIVSAAPNCANTPLSGSSTAAGVVNTYFPGLTGVLTAGQAGTTMTVGAATGAGDPISTGDLVLIIQMQGATIDSSNNANYGAGDGTGRGATGDGLPAGQYEYARVSSISGTTVGLTGTGANDGLINTYTNADATPTSGQFRYQVVRVPQYFSVALSTATTPTATPWDGTSGGVVVLDAAGTLDLNGAIIDVTGLGFRPGLQRQRSGDSDPTLSNTDYVSLTEFTVNGQKAEGIAGTPMWQTGDVDTVGDGYPDGDFARGAPGNAGGGGTDGVPGNNGENSGGGGGGNGGIGGIGGNTWNSALSIGGIGGGAVNTDVGRIVLGGGGGAGSDNDAVLSSSGGAGGGIVIIRAGALTGSGSIVANGANGDLSGQDGSGGGGAGGSVVVLTSAIGVASGLANLHIDALGGNGGDETHPALHGPGGGGGGGRIIMSETTPTQDVSGGINGTHTTSGTPYGAAVGDDGLQTTIPITASPGTNSGSQCIDLAVDKSVSPTIVVPGTEVTYTVTATNQGPFPTSGTAPIAVVDDVPAALANVAWSCTASAGSNCAVANGTGDLSTTANLAVGGVATYTITGDLDPTFTGDLENTATATPPAGVPELTPGDNTDEGDSTAQPQADLSITKTDGATSTDQGSSTTYTIVVSNAGPSSVSNTIISDALPAGATGGTWTCAVGAGGTCDAGSGSMPLTTTADLDPTGSVTYTVAIDVSDTATGNLVNTATVTAPAGVTEVGTGPNSATDTNAVDLVPVAVDDSYATDQGLDLVVTVVADGVLDNDTEGTSTATVSAFDATSVEGGAVAVNANGTFTYSPAGGFSGTDTFDYTITDGNGDTSTATVTIVVDDVPIAENDDYTVEEDATLVVPAATGLLIDDDQGDSPATVVGIDTTGLAGNITTFGTDGSFTFVPNPGATGVTTFTYTIQDANGDQSTATATIDIDALPTAVANDYDVDEDVTLTIPAGTGLLTGDDQGNGPATVTSIDTTGTAGTVTFNADGSFEFIPTPGVTGSTSFTYTITDSDAVDPDSSTATVTIDVNALPTAVADAYETDEDTTLTVPAGTGLLTGDDQGNGPATVTSIDDSGTSGTVTGFAADGSFTFVPDAGFTGDTTITYTIEDADGDTSTAVVTITVDPTPTAEDDLYGTAEGVTLNVSAPGLLDNDDLGSDGVGIGTTVTAVDTTGLAGTLTDNADGSFDFVPNPGFTGSTSFDYTITDGNGDTSSATAMIVVDDLPLAENDSYQTPEGATLTVPVGTGLLADDDVGDGPTTVTSIDTTGTSGTVTFTADGSFEYNPGAFTGVTTFTYTLTDADGDTSTATVTLTVDALPEAADDSYTTDEDVDLTVPAVTGLLANDDQGNGPATVTAVDTTVTNGSVSFSADGGFTFMPDPGFTGSTTFDYTITDADGDESTATATIVVDPVPTAVDDAYSVDEDTTLTVTDTGLGLLDNDDQGSTPATVTSIDDSATDGTVTAFAADGTFTFVADANFFGTTTFDYTITDANGDTSTATATIAVDAVPDPVNDGYITDEDVDLVVPALTGLLANDDEGTAAGTVTAVDTTGTDGTVTFSADGSFTFEPDSSFTGTTTFDYTITDGNGDTATATATIVVDALPTAFDDSYTTDEDTTLVVPVLTGVRSNDDQGTPTATITAIDTTGTAGTVTMNPDGDFTFVPNSGFVGATTFDYTLTDANGDTSAATVTVTVDALPTAVDDSYETDEGVTLNITAPGLLDNDNEGTGSATVTSIDTTGTNGGVSFLPDGSFEFIPTPGPGYTTTFDYTITDGNGDTATATVTVVVDDTPIAVNDDYEIDQDIDLVVPSATGLLSNDIDQGTIASTVTAVDDSASNGSVTAFAADGSFTFVPDAGFVGTTTFSYEITDANGDTSVAIATIVVDDVPVAVDDSYETDEGVTLNIAAPGLLGNDTDQGTTASTVTGVDTTGTDGTVTFLPNGSFDFTPTASFVGTTTFSYEITDANGDTDTAVVTVVVDATPTAEDDSYDVDEGDTLVVPAATGLLVDDDQGTAPATVTDVDTLGTAGTVTTFNADGSFTYVPAPGFEGADTFEYTITDDNGDTSTATATVNVNLLPEATDDSYATNEGVDLNIAAPGLLDNDDLGTPGAATVITDVDTTGTSGAVTVNADGSLDYSPAPGFVGTDTFTYEIADGNGDTDTATVTITVGDLPIAVADAYETDEGVALNVLAATGILDNDDLGTPGAVTVITAVDTTGTDGTVTVNADGSFDYVPNSGFTGDDTFTYEITDGDGDTSSTTVTITVDPTPTAVNDGYVVDQDTTLTVLVADGVIDNDDQGSAPATVTSVDTTGLNGTLTDSADGSFVFDPTPGFVGSTSFGYTITDANGDESSATVTIVVDDTPTAVDDAYETNQDETLTVAAPGLLGNDTDQGTTASTVTSVDTTGLNGTLTDSADGSFVFDPTPGFVGSTSFGYTITDANGDESSATVTIVVDDTPTAVDDAYETNQDTDLVVPAATGLLNNDIDLGTTPTTLTSVDDSASNGSITAFAADGSFTFVPDAGFVGTTTFEYTITDDNGDTSTATATVVIDDTPTAVNDGYVVDQDTNLVVPAGTGMLNNDIDLGTTPTTVTSVDDSASDGSVTAFGADGSFTFVPDAGFVGSTTFEYTITDDNGDTDTATITVIVDDTPTAVDDAYETNQDQAINIAGPGLLGNDTDQGTGFATVQSFDASGAAGTVSVGTNGSLDYTPASGFVGIDTFTYTIVDQNGDTSTATVTITVDDIPVAEDDDYEVDQDTDLVVPAVTGLLVDDDQGTSPATVTSVDDSASDGSVTAFGADGSFTFVPDAGFVGTTTFEYTITDDNGDTSTATATVVVDDTPTAVDDAYDATEDTTLTVLVGDGLLDNDLDLGTTPTTVTSVDTTGLAGMLTESADGSFVFDPTPGFTGDTTFAYTITDDNGDTDTATVTISVDATPGAVADTYGTDEGTTLTIAAPGVLSNDDLGDGPTTVVGIDSTGTDGTVVMDADGSFVFVPTTGFSGTTTFTYTLEDADGDQSIATVTIVVDDLPLASDDAYDTKQDTTLTIAAPGVLGNDDQGTGPATVTSVDTTGLDGTLTEAADGSFVFDPTPGFAGDTSFDYTITDDAGETSTATVTVTVDATPNAVNDGYVVDQDTTLTIAAPGVLGNDDQGTGAATVTSVDTAGLDGTLTEAADGSFVFDPTPGFVGSTTFDYTITDANGDADMATVTIIVDATPVAEDDAYTTDEDTALTVPAGSGLLIDDDQGTAPATVTSVDDSSADGTVTVFGADGSFTFVPDAGFVGDTTFEYTITDDNGDTSTATVTVTVDATPLAEDDDYEVDEGTTLTVLAADGLLVDDDQGTGPATVTAIDATGTAGTVTEAADGSFTFEPNPGFVGTTTFEYTITDANGDISSATATVVVDDVPVAIDDAYETNQDEMLTVAAPGLLDNDTDQGTTASTVTAIDTTGTAGTVTEAADGSFVFEPAPGFVGDTTFDYTITDANGDTSTATVTITVDDVPVAVADAFETDENATLTVAAGAGLLSNDIDLGTTPTTVTSVDTTGTAGTVTENADGSFEFVPTPGFTGTTSFGYTITDDNGDQSSSTVTIVVDPVPTAVADAYEVDQDTTLIVAAPGLLDNDIAGSGASTVTSVDATGTAGTVTENADGSFEFVPTPGFVGTTTFAYTISDTNGDESSSTVTIVVDDTPTAVDDSYGTAEDTTLTVMVGDGLLANDTDLGTTPTTVTSVDTTGLAGTLTENADGSFEFFPSPGFTGSTSFWYTITDNNGDSDTATVTIIVDDLPFAVADAYEVDQDTTLVVPVGTGLVANDDQGTGPATVTAVDTTGTAGTVTENADGSFEFVPTPGFTGDTTFTYTLTDDAGETSTATVTITVDPTPTAVADSYTTDEGVTINVPVAAGLLSNDAPGSGPATVTAVDTAGTNGIVTENPDGSFGFEPTPGFVGDTTFGYTITDANGDTSTSTVAITVFDLPDAQDDNANGVENETLTVTNPADGVLANDDLGEGPTTVTAFDPTAASGSTISINPDGTYTYTPAPGFDGTDMFDYTITDDNGATSTATITIMLDALPAAVADPYSTDQDTTLTVTDPALGVLDNDDQGTGPATVTAFDTTSTNGGTVSVNPDGTFTYTPAPGFGGADRFGYTITDANGDTASGIATVNVIDLPDAVDDVAATEQDTAVDVTDPSLGLLTNDDLGTGPTTISFFDPTSVNGGAVSVNPDGTYSYTPAPGFSGDDTFTYTITDANDETSTATVTITVDAAPEATNDAYPTDQDIAVVVTDPSLGLLANDDLGSEPTTVTAFDSTSVNGGTVSVNPDGTFNYTPAPGYFGNDTFDYTITDLDGDVSTATVTIAVGDVPLAIADSASTTQDVTLTVTDPSLGLLANDDLAIEPTTVTAFDPTSVNGGTVSVNPDGTYSYTPAPGFSGTDTFTYTITDDNGATSTATATIDVDGLPAAVADAYGTDQGARLVISNPSTGVIGNDDQGDGPATVTAFDAASTGAGTVAMNPNGTFTYTPAPGFSGTDTFTYTITDSDGDTSSSTVSIDVVDIPEAIVDSSRTIEGVPVTVSDPIAGLLGNDDLGTGPTTITSFDAVSVSGGTVSVNPDGTYTYTPAPGFSGTDTFTYTITDDNGVTSSAIVTIIVDPLPDAEDDATRTVGGIGITVSNPADGLLDNDRLGTGPTTVTAFDLSSTNGGTVVVNPDGTYSYTPAPGFDGDDTFTYTITDGNGQTSTATVTVTVDALPIAVTDVIDIGVDGSITVTDPADGLVANDDPGTGPTTVTGYDSNSTNGGTVVVNPDGTYSYTPSPGFEGTDTFTYTITDANGQTSTALVTITVEPMPVASPDTLSAMPGIPLVVSDPAFGLIGNDDQGGGGATVTSYDSTSTNGGIVVVNPDGTYSYTPPAGFEGPDTFTYTITDVNGRTSTGTVTILVEGVVEPEPAVTPEPPPSTPVPPPVSPTEPPTTGGPSADIPRTGAESMRVMLLGSLLLGAGLCLLMLGTRRRRDDLQPVAVSSTRSPWPAPNAEDRS